MNRRKRLRQRETELLRKLLAKTAEVERAYAIALGLSGLNDVEATAYRHLQEDVEGLIEEYEEAKHEGATGNCEVQEHSEIMRLLSERYEIAEQILDVRDHLLRDDTVED